jgi:hypothetical protein
VSAVENFADIVAAWAQREPSVQALVLIGSQSRRPDDPVWRADAQSDWDFQIITSNPQLFADAAWTRGLAGAEVRAYAVREARLGDVPKIAAVFAGAEADFVILPAARLDQLKQATELGQHSSAGEVRRNLQSVAVVLRPGWRFLKGAETWEPYYRWIVAEVPDPRLDDAAARSLAEGFVCDYVWTLRKLERGELLAAQRMLHRELAETNFRLLHELKLRRNERSFPDARRIERVAGANEVAGVTVAAMPAAASLHAAVVGSGATLRELMSALAPGWRWPLL